MNQAAVRSNVNTQIQLMGMPQDKLTRDYFRVVDTPMPQCEPGQVLVQVKVISLDAANRAWMQGATYRSALEAGQVMAGGAIAEVIASQDSGYAPGDLVFGDIGWQRYAAMPAQALRKLPRIEPITHLLSVYGIAGLTAYFGLLRIGQPRAGQTVVVSAAAGSVGSLVGQIAKIQGCRVIGVAGGQAKCDWLVQTLGFDAAVDYKAGGLSRALKDAAPEGIDVYFDNVGGDVFEACLFRMKQGGRIACCGAVSQYDAQAPRHGPRGVPGLIVTKRLTLQGFVLYDFYPEIDTAMKDLQTWVAEGRLKVIEDVRQGLENVPDALIGLLAGDNYGKRMVVI